MGVIHRAILVLTALLPLAVQADPESDVRNAVSALAGTSYAWETSVRQRFSGESAEPRLNPNAPLEAKGKFDPKSYAEITLQPSRDALAVPVTAVFRSGDVVGHTPLGWMRRTEMRGAPGPDRPIEFQGQQVRLARALTIALRAAARRPPTEDLFDLIADIKSYRTESGLVLAELRDAAIEKMWAEPRAKSAPEISGTVIFKLSEEGLTEYHVVLAIGFPNSRTKKIAWSMLQWSTRFSGIGTTAVEPTAAAVKKLEEE